MFKHCHYLSAGYRGVQRLTLSPSMCKQIDYSTVTQSVDAEQGDSLMEPNSVCRGVGTTNTPICINKIGYLHPSSTRIITMHHSIPARRTIGPAIAARTHFRAGVVRILKCPFAHRVSCKFRLRLQVPVPSE